MSRRARPITQELERPGRPTISYGVRSGGATEALFVHGLGARWQVFTPLIARLGDDYSCFACDLRGHGESGRSSDYRLADFVDDVIAVIEAVMHPPVDLYGHSLGGWIGLGVAAQRPDLVKALVIADSAIYPDSLDPDLALSYLADLPIALRSMAKSLDQLDPEVMLTFRDGRMLADYRPDDLLHGLPQPLTLVRAEPERGGLMTDRDIVGVQAHRPAATVTTIPGVGHGLHVEDASAVVDVVRTAFTVGDPPVTERDFLDSQKES